MVLVLPGLWLWWHLLRAGLSEESIRPSAAMRAVGSPHMIDPISVRIAIKTCTNCSLRTNCRAPVPYTSPPEPCPIAVIGEAPGGAEDKQGKPFVGPAGQLLRRAINRAAPHPSEQLSDYLAYLNVVCCYPSRTPTSREVAACSNNLEAQLAVLRPRYALIVGGTALGAFLPSTAARKRPDGSTATPASITSLRGQWLEVRRDWGPMFGMVTWHPAAVLREGGLGVGKGTELLSDIESFLAVIYTKPEIRPVYINDSYQPSMG